MHPDCSHVRAKPINVIAKIWPLRCLNAANFEIQEFFYRIHSVPSVENGPPDSVLIIATIGRRGENLHQAFVVVVQENLWPVTMTRHTPLHASFNSVSIPNITSCKAWPLASPANPEANALRPATNVSCKLLISERVVFSSTTADKSRTFVTVLGSRLKALATSALDEIVENATCCIAE